MSVLTLLIDGDICAYQAAFRNQETIEFGNVSHTELNREGMIKDLHDIIESYQDFLGGDIVVCLTDEKNNFRKVLHPEYKLNRNPQAKPELLSEAKQYLLENYTSYVRKNLEADDVMGILATSDDVIKGKKIIVSADKDMRTIPTFVWSPMWNKDGATRDPIEVSPLDADRFHMWQTLTGDPVDGYTGCPGIGKSSIYAEETLGADHDELWDIVLEGYASKGYSEEDAVLQARLANILRATDYNYKTRMPRLWQPYWLVR